MSTTTMANSVIVSEVIEEVKAACSYKGTMAYYTARIAAGDKIRDIIERHGGDCSPMKANFIFRFEESFMEKTTDQEDKIEFDPSVRDIIYRSDISYACSKLLALSKSSYGLYGDVLSVLSLEEIINLPFDYVLAVSIGLGKNMYYGDILNSPFNDIAKASKKPWLFSMIVAGMSTAMPEQDVLLNHPLWESLESCYNIDADDFYTLFFNSLVPTNMLVMVNDSDKISEWTESLKSIALIEMAAERNEKASEIFEDIMESIVENSPIMHIDENDHTFKKAAVGILDFSSKSKVGITEAERQMVRTAALDAYKKDVLLIGNNIMNDLLNLSI